MCYAYQYNLILQFVFVQQFVASTVIIFVYPLYAVAITCHCNMKDLGNAQTEFSSHKLQTAK